MTDEDLAWADLPADQREYVLLILSKDLILLEANRRQAVAFGLHARAARFDEGVRAVGIAMRVLGWDGTMDFPSEEASKP